jgi:hypothetical protein
MKALSPLDLANGGVIPRWCECVDCALPHPLPFAIIFREAGRR